MGYTKLLVLKGTKSSDMSNLVESITWSGRKGAPARSITINLIDDDSYGHDRSGIACEEGHHCIFYWQGNELFQGIFMNDKRSNSKKLFAKAYDSGIYLSNNKDSFCYSNKTASDIFKDCMSRCEMPIGTVADTGYIIPELPKPKTTYTDVILDALSQTYKATGNRFYPLSMKGKISLLDRKKNVLQWVIETGVNLITYEYTKSIENTKTRIRLLTNEGKVLAEKVDKNLEKKIGIFQDVDTPKDSLNEAQLNDLIASILKEKGIKRTLNITALGISNAYSGMCLHVIIKELGISKTYYIDEDTHTFQGRKHTMSLKLLEMSEFKED